MSLRMERVASGCAVLAYCDYCGERIEDCTTANVAYDPAEGGPAA
jgi:hypothetical protein